MSENLGSQTILFVAPSAYPLGGVADWLEYLMAGLAARGARCVLGLTAGHHHLVGPYLSKHPCHDVEPILNPTGSREGRVNALAQAIKRVRPSIVIVTNIVDAYESVRRLRLSGSDAPRIAMALHALQGDLLSDISAESDVLDAVVVTNKLTQTLAVDALGCAERVLYAAYGVPPQTLAGHRGVRPDYFRLFYCGRLEEGQKRVSDLPKLMDRLREIGLAATLSIAGGGPDEAALRDGFKQLRLEDSVDFLGVLSPEALADQYRSHDALIVTSSWETGPIVAWEAMSFGLPVISSRFVGCGLEGALVDGVNSLIFPLGDMEAAAAAVSRLLSPDLRSRVVSGGLDLISARYSKEQSIRQWEAAIRSVSMLPPLPKPIARPRASASGRLDSIFGAAMAERIRRTAGVAYEHADAGGEWPHTSSFRGDELAWLANAGKLDHVE